jgi:hypothetical protein
MPSAESRREGVRERAAARQAAIRLHVEQLLARRAPVRRRALAELDGGPVDRREQRVQRARRDRDRAVRAPRIVGAGRGGPAAHHPPLGVEDRGPKRRGDVEIEGRDARGAAHPRGAHAVRRLAAPHLRDPAGGEAHPLPREAAQGRGRLGEPRIRGLPQRERRGAQGLERQDERDVAGHVGGDDAAGDGRPGLQLDRDLGRVADPAPARHHQAVRERHPPGRRERPRAEADRRAQGARDPLLQRL